MHVKGRWSTCKWCLLLITFTPSTATATHTHKPVYQAADRQRVLSV